MDGKLILEDGTVFHGKLLNNMKATGEVVFNTGMTGYQEILTDPSYCRQIVTLTYPLVGNYGIADIFMQSRKSFVNGFIIGELCEQGSNWHLETELTDFLTKQGIPCLYDVDTRAVTKHIRAAGTMKGIIVPEDAAKTEIDELFAVPIKKEVVSEATTPNVYKMENDGPHVVVMDFGIKQNILDSLHEWGCNLTVVPANTTAEEVMNLNPDGIFLSNGPGDPKDIPEVIENVKKLIGKKPMFGICLGHQILGLALGANTYKLKFGHRGSNQPVKNLETGRVYITSQNHGYAVDEDSLKGLPLVVTHRSINDGTVEGMKHTELPIFSVQFHPEASPGPTDNTYLFDQFVSMLPGVFFVRTHDYFTSLGALIGIVAAIHYERKYVGYTMTKNKLAMVLRILGAFVVYLVLNTILKLPFDKAFLENDSLAALLVRTVRYAIIMFVITGVYPKAFPFYEKIGKGSGTSNNN